jgi:ribose transport system substrate-binding protein
MTKNSLTGRALTFVGSDDEELARRIAHYLAQHLGGRGRIVLMAGVHGSVTSVDRMRGFHAALNDYPDIQVCGTLTGNYQQTVGREVMRDYLAGNPPSFDAVLAANDAMALGAIEAMEDRGVNVPVTGVNAVPAAVTAIKRGALLASANFDALQIACIATEAAIRHLRAEIVPGEILLPVQIVDRANCAAWDRPLEERECPRWEDVVGR